MPHTTASIENLSEIAGDILRYLDMKKGRGSDNILNFSNNYITFDDRAIVMDSQIWGTRKRNLISYVSNEKRGVVFELTVDPWYFQFRSRAEYGMMHYSPEKEDSLGNIWYERKVLHAGGWNAINSIRFDLEEMKKI